MKMNTLINVMPLVDGELKGKEVHIWSATLDRPPAGFYCWLSSDEMQRAERFYFEKDRNRFIVCHGILRKILSGYLGIKPNRIRFSRSKNDKPALVDKIDRDRLCFSLSHSEGLALYAMTRNREIGVDVEYVRDVPDMEKLAERFFSSRENEALHLLPADRKREAFFNCWTRKEAFIKATGDGLNYPLDKFEVSLVPDEPAKLIRIEGDAKASRRWSIQDIRPAVAYIAAFAMKGRIRDVRYREWAE